MGTLVEQRAEIEQKLADSDREALREKLSVITQLEEAETDRLAAEQKEALEALNRISADALAVRDSLVERLGDTGERLGAYAAVMSEYRVARSRAVRLGIEVLEPVDDLSTLASRSENFEIRQLLSAWQSARLTPL